MAPIISRNSSLPSSLPQIHPQVEREEETLLVLVVENRNTINPIQLFLFWILLDQRYQYIVFLIRISQIRRFDDRAKHLNHLPIRCDIDNDSSSILQTETSFVDDGDSHNYHKDRRNRLVWEEHHVDLFWIMWYNQRIDGIVCNTTLLWTFIRVSLL